MSVHCMTGRDRTIIECGGRVLRTGRPRGPGDAMPAAPSAWSRPRQAPASDARGATRDS